MNPNPSPAHTELASACMDPGEPQRHLTRIIVERDAARKQIADLQTDLGITQTERDEWKAKWHDLNRWIQLRDLPR